jgi:cysteine desulfurase
MRIDLDANATTPVLPEVLEAMRPFWLERYGNPSSAHQSGQRTRSAVEHARTSVASLLHCSPREIVFTSGGTESDNLALSGVLQPFLDKKEPAHLITTQIEHHAVLFAAESLERRGIEVTYLAPDRSGVVNPADVEAALRPHTKLVSVMLANNETGALQPAARVAAAARSKGALAHTDAVQAAGKAPLDVRALGVDLLSLSGHKINAPKGVGALYVRRGVRLDATITGHQEKNRRGGTENVAAIVAFGAACALAGRELETSAAHALALRRRLEAGILRLPGASLNGHPERRLPNTAHFSFEGLDGRHLVVALDLEGVRPARRALRRRRTC